MLTIDGLKELGAEVDEGLARCMNKEDFYLRLVNMALTDENFDNLHAAIEAGDLEKGFESAHALKGMLGNVALTNILAPILEMTEALRAREDRDYTPLLEQMDAELAKVKAL